MLSSAIVSYFRFRIIIEKKNRFEISSVYKNFMFKTSNLHAFGYSNFVFLLDIFSSSEGNLAIEILELEVVVILKISKPKPFVQQLLRLWTKRMHLRWWKLLQKCNLTLTVTNNLKSHSQISNTSKAVASVHHYFHPSDCNMN